MRGDLVLAGGLVLVVVAVALAATAFWVVARQRLITRRGGIVDCSLRLAPGRPWRQGLAEYQPGQLCWHRSASLRLRPSACFDRAGLRILRTRRPEPGEAVWVGPGAVVAECEIARGPVPDPPGVRRLELALSDAAFTGLLAWLESSPEFYLRAS